MLFSILKPSWARKHLSCTMTDTCLIQLQRKASSTVTVRVLYLELGYRTLARGKPLLYLQGLTLDAALASMNLSSTKETLLNNNLPNQVFLIHHLIMNKLCFNNCTFQAERRK